MRQASAFIAGAGSVAVLAIGWQVAASALTPPAATPAAAPAASESSATPSATPTPTDAATPTPTEASAAPSATPSASSAAKTSSKSAAASSSTSKSSSSSSGSSSSTSSGTSSSASSSTSNSAASSSSSSSSGITGTFHGDDIAEPRWGGDVQVDVVFKNGKITAVNTISCNATHGANRACPMLAQEVVSAQSANVSTVSGATFTSTVYLQSVQSALDKAGFKG